MMARLSNLLSRPRRLATRVTRAHGWILRRTRGRLLGRNLFFAPRQRVLALTTVGRSSGRERTTALGYLREGDAFVVVASNSGMDRAPAWWRNLEEHAEAEVNAAGERVRVRARMASDEESERLWPRFIEQFSGFDDYRRYTAREIPLVMLEPAEVADSDA